MRNTFFSTEFIATSNRCRSMSAIEPGYHQRNQLSTATAQLQHHSLTLANCSPNIVVSPFNVYTHSPDDRIHIYCQCREDFAFSFNCPSRYLTICLNGCHRDVQTHIKHTMTSLKNPQSHDAGSRIITPCRSN